MSTALTVRQLQLYAAVCLCRYSDSRDLDAKPLDDLVSHLASMTTVADISAWELRGTSLEMTGRGDELPDEITRQVPAPERKLFFGLVEYCVEVGITDMYGAQTDDPKKCLMKCFSFLRSAGLGAADIEARLARSPAVLPWGEPISHQELRRELDRYPECGRYLRSTDQAFESS
jgi:hypothetical protein